MIDPSEEIMDKYGHIRTRPRVHSGQMWTHLDGESLAEGQSEALDDLACIGGRDVQTQHLVLLRAR